MFQYLICIILCVSFIYTILLSSVYAAESMHALKLGWCVGCIGPWALNLTGVYIGIMGVYVLAGQDIVATNAFGDTINAFMDASMAGYIIGSFVFVAGMAAIMASAVSKPSFVDMPSSKTSSNKKRTSSTITSS